MDGPTVCKSNKFHILFSNVDVFNVDKLHELKIRLEKMEVEPHIIALQEVKPKNYRLERYLSDYNIEGYELLGKNLQRDKEGRGILLYVKMYIPFCEVQLQQNFCEYICVEVHLTIYCLLHCIGVQIAA